MTKPTWQLREVVDYDSMPVGSIGVPAYEKTGIGCLSGRGYMLVVPVPAVAETREEKARFFKIKIYGEGAVYCVLYPQEQHPIGVFRNGDTMEFDAWSKMFVCTHDDKFEEITEAEAKALLSPLENDPAELRKRLADASAEICSLKEVIAQLRNVLDEIKVLAGSQKQQHD